MRRPLLTAIVVTVTTALAGAAPPTARLKVTHRDLLPQCLNGRAVPQGVRAWTVSGETSLVFTMRAEPRAGLPAPQPGWSAVTFTPEAGHRYEVEVRADTMAFSTRTWRAGAWTPVVRDRTTDAIVSGAPAWLDAPTCR